ncbi:MAG TPA: TonB family protein, partial [Sphingobacteriaceae bacterium]
ELFITQKVREATIPLQVIYDPVIVQVSEEAPKWTVTEIIMWIYLIGASIFLARFIIQLIWLKYNLKAKRGAAFSFFKALIIDVELPEKESIINHEKVHIRQWHSLDVILIELAAVLNWFNPVAYIYKKEIKHIHEFIADEEAAGLQQSKSDYALLLLSNTLGVNPHQLSNSFFNQSLLKRRILMLGKSRSRRTGLLKYGLSAPLFAAMLIFSAATAKQDKITLINESKKLTGSLFSTLTQSEEPDQYKSFLKRNPSVKELAWKTKPYRVTVYLKNGDWESYNMENLKAKSEAKAKYGEFPYPPPPPESDRIRSSLPTPAKYIKESDGSQVDTNRITDFSKVQVLPEFPGGNKGFGAYLIRNIKYPEPARINKITGRVFISFVVEKDGQLTNIKVLRGLGFGTDEEAVRVLKNSPRWNPGMIEGKPVRVQYTLPISFQPGRTPSSAPKKELETGSENDTASDFASVEVLPEFPGGEKAFSAYIADNIKYPELAKANKISGRVFVSFIVEKDGELTDIKVLRGLGYGTDEEAIRILKNSQRWKPGIQNGKPVRVQYTIPISFQLTKKDNSKSQIQKVPPSLYIIDGKKITAKEFDRLELASIKKMNVLKGDAAEAKYGKKGWNGVIEIYTKTAVP